MNGRSWRCRLGLNRDNENTSRCEKCLLISVKTPCLRFTWELLDSVSWIEEAMQKAKARLITQGHTGFDRQGRVVFRSKKESGCDYWAPTAPLESARCLASHAALFGHVVSSCDLAQAYLQTVYGAQATYAQLPDFLFEFLPEEFEEEIW